MRKGNKKSMKRYEMQSFLLSRRTEERERQDHTAAAAGQNTYLIAMQESLFRHALRQDVSSRHPCQVHIPRQAIAVSKKNKKKKTIGEQRSSEEGKR